MIKIATFAQIRRQQAGQVYREFPRIHLRVSRVQVVETQEGETPAGQVFGGR